MTFSIQGKLSYRYNLIDLRFYFVTLLLSDEADAVKKYRSTYHKQAHHPISKWSTEEKKALWQLHVKYGLDKAYTGVSIENIVAFKLEVSAFESALK